MINTIKWVVVRPSSLIDEENISYIKLILLQLEVQCLMMAKLVELMLLPLFNKLITDQNLWEKWKGQMPNI